MYFYVLLLRFCVCILNQLLQKQSSVSEIMWIDQIKKSIFFRTQLNLYMYVMALQFWHKY